MLEIVKKCNRLDEAFLFLYQMANDEDIAKIKNKNLNVIPSERERFDRIFDLLGEIESYVKSHLHLNKDRINYLFKNHGKSYSTLATAAMLWNYRLRYQTTEDYHKILVSYSDAKRISQIAEAIDDEACSAYGGDMPSSITELIRFISETGYDAAAGFEMLKLYNNHELYFEETAAMINQVMQLFEECNDQFAQVEEIFYKYWSVIDENEGIFELMKKGFNISWNISKKGVVVIPVLFQPLSASISMDEKYKEKDVIHIGAGMIKEFILHDERLRKEDLVAAAKVFADKSKVDILEFIKDQPAYGKEIADHLKLTTATISYHMNTLLSLSFVKTSITSGKVYYQLDREKILLFSQQLAAFFS